MYDVIHVRRQLTHKGMRIARRNIVELQSLSRSTVYTTRKDVLRAVWEVEDADWLGLLLGVPPSKRDEIKRQFSQKRKKAYISIMPWTVTQQPHGEVL